MEALLSTRTRCSSREISIFASVSSALTALVMVLTQCPQVMSGTLMLIMVLSFVSAIMMQGSHHCRVKTLTLQ